MPPGELLTNWAGNVSYSADVVHRACTVEEVRSHVRSARKFKVLGTRHSFNAIADSRDALLSLAQLQDIHLDASASEVTIGPGVTYGQLGPYLDTRGFALHNLASLPHISLAGACSTATHGAGQANGALATAVSRMQLVTAGGELLTLSPGSHPAEFAGAVVSLGALGVITQLTLKIEPAFQVRQYVYQDLHFRDLQQHFGEIQASGYSVSLFTDWRHNRITQMWIKQRVADTQPPSAPEELFGAKLARRNVHPIPGFSAENCTEQMGAPGPWFERLPHFRMGFMPSAGEELQSEYLVPRHHAIDAILAIEGLHAEISPHLLISEIRAIAADDFWLSMCYRQPSIAIHFTWRRDWPAVKNLLPLIEKELAPFQPRPHWGKLFTMPPAQLRARYEKLGDFLDLAAKFDPQGKFRNEFLDTNLFA